VFICNHCPFCDPCDELVRLANDYRVTGFGFVAICNDVGNYKQDGPRQMQRVADKHDYPFPTYMMKLKK
jgi:hypothetical protein